MKVLLGLAVYHDDFFTGIPNPTLMNREIELAALPSSLKEIRQFEKALCDDKENWTSSPTTGMLKPKKITLMGMTVLS